MIQSQNNTQRLFLAVFLMSFSTMQRNFKQKQSKQKYFWPLSSIANLTLHKLIDQRTFIRLTHKTTHNDKRIFCQIEIYSCSLLRQSWNTTELLTLMKAKITNLKKVRFFCRLLRALFYIFSPSPHLSSGSNYPPLRAFKCCSVEQKSFHIN